MAVRITHVDLSNCTCVLLRTQPSLAIFMHIKVWKSLGKTKRQNKQRKVLIVECWLPENTSKTSCGEGKPEFIVYDGKEGPAFAA